MDLFRNIGGVVTDPLQILGHEQQIDAGRDIAWVFHHIGEQLAKQAREHVVHFVVAMPHRDRLVGVALDIGIENLLHHGLIDLRHAWDRVQRLDRRLLGEPHGALGDIGRVIADPLQVVGDLHGHHDQAQVDRHGLPRRQQADRVLIDLLFHAIDLIVLLDHPLGLFDVAIDQGFDRACDLLFDHAAHLEDLARQQRDLLIVRFDDVVGWHACTLIRTGR